MISPAACCLAKRSMRAVSAIVSLIAAMPGGQGCPLRALTCASPSGMRRSGPVILSSPSRPSSWLAPAGCREGDVAAQVVADGCPPQLCQGGQSGVPADAVPDAGLRLVPAEHVLPGFERFLRSAAPGDGYEIGHGRGGAFRRPAQVEGQVVRAGDQVADEQEALRAAGGEQRPVREPGTLRSVPARPEAGPSRTWVKENSACKIDGS